MLLTTRNVCDVGCEYGVSERQLQSPEGKRTRLVLLNLHRFDVEAL